MYKRILLFFVMVAFGVSSLSYASLKEEPKEKRDTRLFPHISEKDIKFHTGIPLFDPQEDMAYLSEESQYRIQGLAESFSVLRDYLHKKIAKKSWVVDSSSSSTTPATIGSAQSSKEKLESSKIEGQIRQLTELQNACCYFLSHQEYGVFLEPFHETLEYLKSKHKRLRIHSHCCSLSLKDKLKFLLQAPTLFSIAIDSGTPVRYVVCSAEDETALGLESIKKLSYGADDYTGFYSSSLDKYAKNPKSHKEKESSTLSARKEREVPTLYLPEKFKAHLDQFGITQGTFQRVRRDLKVKMTATDKAALGGDSIISSMAKDIKLIPEFYEKFKEARYQRIEAYRLPAVGSSLDDKTRDTHNTEAFLLETDLDIAEILMTLEDDFSKALKDLSKDKIKFWLREGGLIL